MGESVSQSVRGSLEVRAALRLLLACVLLAFTSLQYEVNQMPKLNQGEIGSVRCATTTQTKTVDGKTHEMVRAFPLIVLPEGQNNQKAFGAALQNWLTIAAKIAEGEAIEILNDKGEVVAKPVPTDEVPGLSEERNEPTKDKDGNPVDNFIVYHGTNFSKSLPVDFAELVDAMNTGIKSSIYRDGQRVVIDEYREGGGRRGRAALVFDPAKLG